MRAATSIFALISIFCLAGQATAQAVVPEPSPVLAYEGRLLESNVPATGARTFVFSILGSTENELWTSGPQTLTVTSGIYGVVLGGSGMPPLPSTLALQTGLQLRVTADGVQLSPDVALIPALQASAAWSVIGPFLGDISGTQQSISVDKLKGTPLDLTGTPSSGEVLTFNGTSWIASAPAGGGQGPAGPPGPQGTAGLTGSTGSTGPAGAIGSQGPVGPAGPAGIPGVDGNTVLNGTVNPTSSIGVDGDFYFNTATSTIFGPRITGNWPAGVPLSGPAGSTGTTGPAGPPGAAGTTGPAGPPGVAGSTGPQGSQGVQGIQGVAGAPGATAAAGPQGPLGLTGAPGAAGATGPQGPDGATGPAGPSTVTYTSNGSTINLLQKLTTVSFASRAVDATTSDATGLIGIASSTVGTGAAVLVNVYGTAPCVFEGATAAGDYFQASPTVAGNCRDVGPSYPVTNQVLGFVLSSNGGAGTYTVFLFGVEIRTSAAAPVTSVFNRAGAVTAAANDYNFNQLAGSLASSQDYTVGSAGTYTKLTTNAQGRVGSGSQAAASDLSNGTTGAGAIVLATAPTIASPSLSAPSVGTTAQTSTYISNGSTANLLQILTTVSSSSHAANSATATTGGVVGIAQSTVSAGGSVEVATSGKATCQFDATAVTAGDYVQISSVTAGNCHDAGSTRPASGQIIGFAIATGSASTAQAVRLFDGEVMALPAPSAAVVATSQTTTSGSYTNLATSGPAVTVNISSNGKALVTMTVQSSDADEDGCNMAFAISGNTTVVASDTQSLDILSFSGGEVQASATYLVTGLAAGGNTFTAMYKLSPEAVGDGDTCTFVNRNIIVTPY